MNKLIYKDELTKQDTNMTKGLAIILMVILHLFCRIDNLPYECLKIGEVPLVYCIGQFADCCVVLYCFCSGYALRIICEKFDKSIDYYKNRLKSVFKFLINYWIVLIVFSIVGLIFDKTGAFPGNLNDFLGKFFLYDLSYSTPWWFVFIYVLLVLLSRPVNIMIEKINPIVGNIFAFIIYLLAYNQRFNYSLSFDIPILDWAIDRMALLGTSMLPFIWGMYFYKYKVFSKIRQFVYRHFKNCQVIAISFFVLCAMIIGHGMVVTFFISPFTGIVTVLLFNIIDKKKFVNSIFNFLGNHSTNIWLTHMFFYLVLFKDFVFVAKYPVFIFLFMMFITICCSYIINLIYKPIIKLIK